MSERESRRAPSERDLTSAAGPDVTRLVVMIAAAAVAAIVDLAAVVNLSVGWVLLASLLPVVFWGLLLREIHRLLRHSGGERTGVQ